MSPPTTTTTTNDHSTIERSRRNRNRSKKNGININNVSNGHIYTVTPIPPTSSSSSFLMINSQPIPPPHIHHLQQQQYQSTNLTGTMTPIIITVGDPNNSLIIPQQQQQQQLQQQQSLQDFNPIEFIEQHGHIRWPKNEFCTPCNCMCFFIAFIFLVTALMSGIYYNLNFFDGKHLRERVFKAKFVVRNQDFLQKRTGKC
ncbi:hypothetical protein DERF_012178 [Dermatophagoides farinae]|uniref:Uncharacterized protein n=1 Tax=Dermatophagoides farinae TaxID=6954 RepID=A0A922HPE8_DERFA|nr:hypothetical protein DERF_012178 [Dermatophagoides farinae]